MQMNEISTAKTLIEMIKKDVSTVMKRASLDEDKRLAKN